MSTNYYDEIEERAYAESAASASIPEGPEKWLDAEIRFKYGDNTPISLSLMGGMLSLKPFRKTGGEIVYYAITGNTMVIVEADKEGKFSIRLKQIDNKEA